MYNLSRYDGMIDILLNDTIDKERRMIEHHATLMTEEKKLLEEEEKLFFKETIFFSRRERLLQKKKEFLSKKKKLIQKKIDLLNKRGNLLIGQTADLFETCTFEEKQSIILSKQFDVMMDESVVLERNQAYLDTKHLLKKKDLEMEKENRKILKKEEKLDDLLKILQGREDLLSMEEEKFELAKEYTEFKNNIVNRENKKSRLSEKREKSLKKSGGLPCQKHTLIIHKNFTNPKKLKQIHRLYETIDDQRKALNKERRLHEKRLETGEYIEKEEDRVYFEKEYDSIKTEYERLFRYYYLDNFDSQVSNRDILLYFGYIMISDKDSEVGYFEKLHHHFLVDVG